MERDGGGNSRGLNEKGKFTRKQGSRMESLHKLVAWNGRETFSFYFCHSADHQWRPHPLPVAVTTAQQ